MKQKIYSRIDEIPTGSADDSITSGCLVLEGGGWKGLYTLGVLDCMMQNGINFSATVGCSAGALSAIGYVAGQIGWGARIDLTYRHDQNYCGIGAMKRDGGITGFSYLYRDILRQMPLNKKRLQDPARRLAVSATNLLTGKVEYFEKGKCNLSKAVQASATVPYISRPVMIGGVPYLDGGCAEKIPFSWAQQCGERKIVVVRTRERAYRRDTAPSVLTAKMYRKYPEFVRSMDAAPAQFNETADLLEHLAGQGEIFQIAPSEPVTVTRFDGDLEKLGALYWLGMHDMEARLGTLRDYLQR